jgi:isoprenylcysteine carboxyl methyltransferase (ICMT) family protein YpbQ
MTVYLVILLPKMPYIHRMYRVMANPNFTCNGILECIGKWGGWRVCVRVSVYMCMYRMYVCMAGSFWHYMFLKG